MDFQKAFDTVIHPGIKYKLLKSGINGYFYRIICDMYNKNLLSIKIGNKLTNSFVSELGVRQGDVLSPNIFKLFINDFSNTIQDCAGSVFLSNKKISSLLYADDLVLISDSEQGLQNKLNILNDYCNEWCLKVNTNKTKIIIFNKTGKLIAKDFYMSDHKNRLCPIL